MALWKNWYRMHPDWKKDALDQNSRTESVSCPTCGVTRTIEPGQKFETHCGGQSGEGFADKAEAELYLREIYQLPWCETLGSYPVGKQP